MPAPKPTITEIKNGINRYIAGDRPWRQTLNRVDWFILHENELYPLKYTYALAMDVPPASFTTNQMKSAMSELPISYHSLKAEGDLSDDFDAQVAKSRKEPEKRKKRLSNADDTPKLVITYQATFRRNPDVVAEVLERSKGICEHCGKDAPFIRSSDGTPFLEVHHKMFLSKGGKDTVENAEALCPNCHREKHYG